MCADSAFPIGQHGRLPVGDFRSSMAGLRFPLSTLRHVPHGAHRMTRGRCDSLLLQRGALASPTPGRSARRTVLYWCHLRRWPPAASLRRAWSIRSATSANDSSDPTGHAQSAGVDDTNMRMSFIGDYLPAINCRRWSQEESGSQFGPLGFPQPQIATVV
jgi:hypothetical protein